MITVNRAHHECVVELVDPVFVEQQGVDEREAFGEPAGGREGLGPDVETARHHPAGDRDQHRGDEEHPLGGQADSVGGLAGVRDLAVSLGKRRHHRVQEVLDAVELRPAEELAGEADQDAADGR
jgi:hypothetical protein